MNKQRGASNSRLVAFENLNIMVINKNVSYKDNLTQNHRIPILSDNFVLADNDTNTQQENKSGGARPSTQDGGGTRRFDKLNQMRHAMMHPSFHSSRPEQKEEGQQCNLEDSTSQQQLSEQTPYGRPTTKQILRNSSRNPAQELQNWAPLAKQQELGQQTVINTSSASGLQINKNLIKKQSQAAVAPQSRQQQNRPRPTTTTAFIPVNNTQSIERRQLDLKFRHLNDNVKPKTNHMYARILKLKNKKDHDKDRTTAGGGVKNQSRTFINTSPSKDYISGGVSATLTQPVQQKQTTTFSTQGEQYNDGGLKKEIYSKNNSTLNIQGQESFVPYRSATQTSAHPFTHHQQILTGQHHLMNSTKQQQQEQAYGNVQFNNQQTSTSKIDLQSDTSYDSSRLKKSPNQYYSLKANYAHQGNSSSTKKQNQIHNLISHNYISAGANTTKQPLNLLLQKENMKGDAIGYYSNTQNSIKIGEGLTNEYGGGANSSVPNMLNTSAPLYPARLQNQTTSSLQQRAVSQQSRNASHAGPEFKIQAHKMGGSSTLNNSLIGFQSYKFHTNQMQLDIPDARVVNNKKLLDRQRQIHEQQNQTVFVSSTKKGVGLDRCRKPSDIVNCKSSEGKQAVIKVSIDQSMKDKHLKWISDKYTYLRYQQQLLDQQAINEDIKDLKAVAEQQSRSNSEVIHSQNKSKDWNTKDQQLFEFSDKLNTSFNKAPPNHVQHTRTYSNTKNDQLPGIVQDYQSTLHQSIPMGQTTTYHENSTIYQNQHHHHTHQLTHNQSNSNKRSSKIIYSYNKESKKHSLHHNSNALQTSFEIKQSMIRNKNKRNSNLSNSKQSNKVSVSGGGPDNISQVESSVVYAQDDQVLQSFMKLDKSLNQDLPSKKQQDKQVQELIMKEALNLQKDQLLDVNHKLSIAEQCQLNQQSIDVEQFKDKQSQLVEATDINITPISITVLRDANHQKKKSSHAEIPTTSQNKQIQVTVLHAIRSPKNNFLQLDTHALQQSNHNRNHQISPIIKSKDTLAISSVLSHSGGFRYDKTKTAIYNKHNNHSKLLIDQQSNNNNKLDSVHTIEHPLTGKHANQHHQQHHQYRSYSINQSLQNFNKRNIEFEESMTITKKSEDIFLYDNPNQRIRVSLKKNLKHDIKKEFNKPRAKSAEHNGGGHYKLKNLIKNNPLKRADSNNYKSNVPQAMQNQQLYHQANLQFQVQQNSLTQQQRYSSTDQQKQNASIVLKNQSQSYLENRDRLDSEHQNQFPPSSVNNNHNQIIQNIQNFQNKDSIIQRELLNKSAQIAQSYQLLKNATATPSMIQTVNLDNKSSTELTGQYIEGGLGDFDRQSYKRRNSKSVISKLHGKNIDNNSTDNKKSNNYILEQLNEEQKEIGSSKRQLNNHTNNVMLHYANNEIVNDSRIAGGTQSREGLTSGAGMRPSSQNKYSRKEIGTKRTILIKNRAQMESNGIQTGDNGSYYNRVAIVNVCPQEELSKADLNIGDLRDKAKIIKQTKLSDNARHSHVPPNKLKQNQTGINFRQQQLSSRGVIGGGALVPQSIETGAIPRQKSPAKNLHNTKSLHSTFDSGYMIGNSSSAQKGAQRDLKDKQDMMFTYYNNGKEVQVKTKEVEALEFIAGNPVGTDSSVYFYQNINIPIVQPQSSHSNLSTLKTLTQGAMDTLQQSQNLQLSQYQQQQQQTIDKKQIFVAGSNTQFKSQSVSSHLRHRNLVGAAQGRRDSSKMGRNSTAAVAVEYANQSQKNIVISDLLIKNKDA